MNADRPIILGLGGTLREGSSSEQALLVALERVEARGGRTIALTGEALALPHYDPQLGAPSSPKVVRLLDALRSADGLIISSACYHGSISGLLKNAIDYVEELRKDKRAYLDGMPVGCVGCGLGWQGPNLVISNLRSIVHSLRGWPSPLGVAINTAASTFERGGCREESVVGQLDTMAAQVLDFARMRIRGSYACMQASSQDARAAM